MTKHVTNRPPRGSPDTTPHRLSAVSFGDMNFYPRARGQEKTPSSASYLSTFPDFWGPMDPIGVRKSDSPRRRKNISFPLSWGEGGGHAPPGEGSLRLPLSSSLRLHRRAVPRTTRAGHTPEKPTVKAALTGYGATRLRRYLLKGRHSAQHYSSLTIILPKDSCRY